MFPSGYEGDVLGPFVNRNQFAAWIELVLPIALFLAATDRKLRSLYALAAVAMFSSVVASASRAGFALVLLETGAVFGLIAVRGAARRSGLVRHGLQFTALTAAGVLVMGYSGLSERLSAAGPERLRFDALRASVEMIRSRPWMGSGLGTWPSMYPRYAGFDSGLVMNQAHNDWAQWAAEGGLPFAALLLIFAILLSKSASRSIYGVGIVSFLLHAFVDYPMQQRPALAAWFFAIAGCTYAGSVVPKSDHDVLRGIGRSGNRVSRRDSAGLQASGAARPSGPVFG
jgi:O-antigen ligase